MKSVCIYPQGFCILKRMFIGGYLLISYLIHKSHTFCCFTKKKLNLLTSLGRIKINFLVFADFLQFKLLTYFYDEFQKIKIAYSPWGNFNLRNFHHAVNNIPMDNYLLESGSVDSSRSNNLGISPLISFFF